MHGYIKLHRKIIGWEWYSDHNTFCLFMHLLLTARFDDGRWQGTPIKAGQVITSLSSLSKATGLSIKSVRTSLNHLKSSGEVTDELTNRYRLITVVNWTLYQSRDDEVASQEANIEAPKGQASGKQAASKGQQRKNVKNEKNGKGARFTPPTTQQVSDYCTGKGYAVNAERFVNYYQSKGWRVGTSPMKDWKAAVRNWKRKDNSQQDQSEIKPVFVD